MHIASTVRNDYFTCTFIDYTAYNTQCLAQCFTEILLYLFIHTCNTVRNYCSLCTFGTCTCTTQLSTQPFIKITLYWFSHTASIVENKFYTWTFKCVATCSTQCWKLFHTNSTNSRILVFPITNNATTTFSCIHLESI